MKYRILLIDLFQSSEDRVYQIQIPIPTICEQTERWGTQFHWRFEQGIWRNIFL